LEIKIVLAAFAAYRLTGLLIDDDGPFRIFAIVREWIVKQTTIAPYGQREPWLSLYGLVTCHLCLGVWMAALCAGLVMADNAIGNGFLLVFGIAGAQALLSKVR